MPYYDEETMESYYAGDEEFEPDWGTEGRWETETVGSGEGSTEAKQPVYRRGATRLPIKRYPFRPVSGASGASIRTPGGGRAQIQFPKPVATQVAVNDLAKELKTEIASLSASVKKVNEALDKNTAIVDKKINSLNTDFKKTQQQNQMMTLLPLLLAKAPELETIKLQKGTEAPAEFKVLEQKAKADGSSTLLLLMMMGGFGGQGMGMGMESSNMMSMLLMVLLLSGSGGLKL